MNNTNEQYYIENFIKIIREIKVSFKNKEYGVTLLLFFLFLMMYVLPIYVFITPFSSSSNTIKMEDLNANGDITGVRGNTSNPGIQKLFEKPLNVIIKNSSARGNITGVDLNVDQNLKVNNYTKIETDTGTVIFDPSQGNIEFNGN